MHYFKKSNNYPHGIMFHHFHDDKKHLAGQGSINKNEFYKIIKFIGRENIIDAQEFSRRLTEGKLSRKDVCITFDDGIKSQLDIALPLLENLEIKSFFFVYGSIFTNNLDLLEIYRFFRINYFKKINDFYDAFNKHLNKRYIPFLKKKSKQIKSKKEIQPFYSIRDIEFRLLRNDFLSRKKYNHIMLKMFKEKNFHPKKYLKRLFITKNDLIKINSLGHQIGLHSYSHPTILDKLPFKKQYMEYKKNLTVLSEILKIKKNNIKTMSHPSGRYNKNTLKALKLNGIEIGFKNTMDESKIIKNKDNLLEIPRENHSIILSKM